MTAADALKKSNAALNRHDPKANAEVYSARAIVYDPFHQQPLKGKEAVLKDTEAFIKAFPDIKIKPSIIMGRGNTFAGEGVLTGTHKGPIEGPSGTIQATGKRMKVHGAIFGRVDAKGLIVEERRYIDMSAIMAQLGLQPGT